MSKTKFNSNPHTNSWAYKIAWGLFAFSFITTHIVLLATKQYSFYFDLPFASLIFTISLSTEGADLSFLSDMVFGALPRLLITIGLFGGVSFFCLQTKVITYLSFGKSQRYRFQLRYLLLALLLPFSVYSMYTSITYMDERFGVSDYFNARKDITTVYEDFYLSPERVSITPLERKRT